MARGCNRRTKEERLRNHSSNATTVNHPQFPSCSPNAGVPGVSLTRLASRSTVAAPKVS